MMNNSKGAFTMNSNSSTEQMKLRFKLFLPYLRTITVINDTDSTYLGFSFFYIVVGTALNLWCLCAILTHPELRQKLRNKLICDMLVLHLTECVIRLPVFFVVMANMKLNPFVKVPCHVVTASNHITLIQDFVSNWLLVVIIGFFIFCIADFRAKLTTFLSPIATRVVTLTLLLLPWVCSLFLVPYIMKDFYDQSMKDQNITDDRRFCLTPTADSLVVFKSLDTAAPILLNIVLVSVAAVLSFRRGTLTSSSKTTMDRQLIGQSAEEYILLPYVIAVIIACLCDVGFLVKVIFKTPPGGIALYRMNVASKILSDSRVLFMPLPWLMFRDVRERCLSWRPWKKMVPDDNDGTARRDENDA